MNGRRQLANSHAARRGSERGQGLIELIVVLPMLMFLIMGIIQFALLYQTKSVLNHATFLAARAGALSNGQIGGFNPLASGIRQGLAAGMAPLFNHGTSIGALTQARAEAFTEVRNPVITNINIVSPTRQMFNDFGIQRLDGGAGKEIPNDSLQYRNSAQLGATSQVSIQDANLLKIEVTYCARLIVPIANRALHSIALGISSFWNPANDVGTTRNPLTCPQILSANDYRIPVKSVYVIRMESPFRQ